MENATRARFPRLSSLFVVSAFGGVGISIEWLVTLSARQFLIHFSFLSAIWDQDEANNRASTSSKSFTGFLPFTQLPLPPFPNFLVSCTILPNPSPSLNRRTKQTQLSVLCRLPPTLSTSPFSPTMATLAIDPEEESTESCIVVANRTSPRSRTSTVPKVSSQRQPTIACCTVHPQVISC